MEIPRRTKLANHANNSSTRTTMNGTIMKFHIFTLFPNLFESPISEGIVGRARNSGLIDIRIYNIRDYSDDKHGKVDDYPFGGGPGMLLKPEPVFESIRSNIRNGIVNADSPLILLSPQGRQFNQEVAKELSHRNEISLICGRYEGFDERIRSNLATDEISIGDFVLSGGEIPAITIIDAVSRLLPGVISSIESAENDSFFNGLLQHPQYTRPSNFEGLEVPKVLLSGNHAEINEWRRKESLKKTKSRRPDLISGAHLTEAEQEFLDNL